MGDGVSCCEAVSFSAQVCPHVRANVTTVEEKGMYYRYELYGRCDLCGPLSKEVQT